ncbi:MAG: InlB B-repeat-containing protein [Fibrobacter sp.]|nr:InlB B-repeat-containing protein [Fibrobacter sp.]
MHGRFAAPLLLIFVVISSLLHCQLPPNPADPSNTGVELLIRNSHWLESNLSIADTVDKPIQIGVVINLPENIDSIRLSVKAEGKSLFDTLLQSFSSSNRDTIWKAMSFADTGYKFVSIVPYSKVIKLSPVSAGITIANKTSTIQPENHPPKWTEKTLNVALNDTARYQLKLSPLCSDPDKEVLRYAISGKTLPGDTIIDSLYIFQASAATIGKNSVELIASDPSGLKDTMELVLNVSASGTDNSPPEVTIIAPDRDSSVTNAENYVVDMLCSDASGIDSVYAIFNGKTTSAVLENGHYKIAITGLVVGVYNAIELIVRDKSVNALKTTKTIKIKYAQGFTIAYNGNGNLSGTVPIDTGKYENGATVTVKGNTGNLVKTGFTFVGWATSASGTEVYKGEETFKIGTSDVTLYAIWKQNTTYALIITSSNGEVTISPNATVFDSGTIVTLTPAPSTGYHFAGWSGALSGTTNPATITMNSTKSVTANFEANPPNTFALTVLATNGTVQKTPDQTQYDSGSVVALTAVPNAGYQFTGWSGGITGTTNPSSVTMIAAKSVIANFEIKTYALSVTTANGSVTKSPDANSYDSGAVVTLTAVSDAGYQFTGWSGDITGNTNPSSIIMNAPKSVTANFALNTYQLTVLAGTGGLISAPTGFFPKTVNSGEAIILTASASSGHRFVNWTITPSTAGSITNATSATSATVTLTSGNATVLANFMLELYQLNVTSTVGGTISKPDFSQSWVASGNSVAIQVDFNTSDYNFVNWTVTSGAAEFVDASLPSTYVIPSSNATVRANLSPVLKVTLSPEWQTTAWGQLAQTITSTVTGGTPPYTYCLKKNRDDINCYVYESSYIPYFFPAGTYEYFMEVTDAKGTIAISNISTHVITEAVTE